MIFELLNLIYSILYGVFIYFPVNFIVFFIIPSLLRRYKASKYKPYTSGLTRKDVKVSVIIPEYNEDLDIFEKCVKSVYKNKPDEIIIVHDDGRKEVAEIGKKYGAKVFSVNKRLGKRRALILGWLNAIGDIIVQVDSDTIMENNTLEEIIKPFSDPKVAGVQGHPILFRTGGRLPYLYGQIIELSRDVVSKALNGSLPVIDGKIAAYRRSFLIEAINFFDKEKYGKRTITIADDKALTYYANFMGYKTVYQSTAIAKSAAQPTISAFINQQLRWARSGYLYLVKEIRSGLFFMMGSFYRFHILTYLLAPFSFLFALTQAVLVPANPTLWSWGYLIDYGINIPIILYSLLIFIVGININMRLSLSLLGIKFKEIGTLDYTAIGVFGLFVIFPMFLYAAITHFKASEWRQVIGGG
ncbi:chitooligosaccharide synthase NodC [Sulfurisphaera javensis]|uniref:Chitooligosaccharide synthase NodC n=1 Tax=Sulfurisphaera javensis TaxID=2049879 RepID=A0AAT9GV60_9CREN